MAPSSDGADAVTTSPGSSSALDGHDGYVAVPSSDNDMHGKDHDAVSIDDSGDCDERRLGRGDDDGGVGAAAGDGGGDGSECGRILTEVMAGGAGLGEPVIVM